MARDFTKNTANYLSWGVNAIGPLLNGLSAISCHAWIRPDTFGTGTNDNTIVSVDIGNAQVGLTLVVNGSGANKVLRALGRSSTSDSLQAKNATSDLTLSTWHSVGMVSDIGGDTITPYVNGVAEGGGAVIYASATYTNSGDQTTGDGIGVRDHTSHTAAIQFDGRICEVAIWSVDIGANAFASLARGVSPYRIRAGNLIVYMPLFGIASPEVCHAGSGKLGTITGSLPVIDHAPVIPCFGYAGWRGAFTAAAAAANPTYQPWYHRAPVLAQ